MQNAGKYQVIRHLASGGMAEVHLAKTTGIGGFERYVVVKKILGENAKDPRFVSMFLDEARLSAQLHHANIAQVYDVGEDGGTYFFTMEYVHGEDVRALLRKVSAKKTQVPVEHALAIVAGAAAGLHYAHEKRGLNLVHRDVSPSNVLVAYDGAVKLVDFGIAKAATRSSETSSGTLKGKVAYMSPEQCLGKSIDRRSDVFSLGVVMYELTTMTRLFRFENDYVTMNQIVTGTVPPPSRRRDGYPEWLEQVVMRCLEKDPEKRFQTAGELVEAIDRHAVVSSQTALAKYMRELFGERVEPWLEPEKTGVEHVSLMEGTVAPVTRETVPDTGVPTPVAKTQRSRRKWLLVVPLIAASAIGGGVMATRKKPRTPASTPAPAPVPTPALPTSRAPAATIDAGVPVDAAPVEVDAAPMVVKKKPKAKKKEPVKVDEPAGRDTNVLIRPSQRKP